MESNQELIKRLATTQNHKLDPVERFRGKLQHELYSLGLFEDQAKAIVAAYEADPSCDVMQGRFGDRVDGYPPMVWALTRRGIDAVADKWLETNCPQHWARPLFT
jgi:hypothetical protein